MSPRSWRELHDGLVRLAVRADAVDIRHYESEPSASDVAELALLVIKLMHDAHSLFGVMLSAAELLHEERLGGAPPPNVVPLAHLSFERALDAALEEPDNWNLSTVCDVLFLVRMELTQRNERFSQVARQENLAATVEECDGALRRVRKALITVDQASARAGLAEAKLDYASALEVSLAVRRTYARLRRHIRKVGQPDASRLPAQLRDVGSALATVVGWTGYPTLRIRDRMQIRDLQRRLLAWFRAGRDIVEGERIWQDIRYFAEMLEHVNRRQELREHDTKLLEQAWRVVSSAGDHVEPSSLTDFAALQGLDDDLDELLASGALDRRSWRSVLGGRLALSDDAATL